MPTQRNLLLLQTAPGHTDTVDRQDRAGGEQDDDALVPRKSGLPPVQEHKQLEGEIVSAHAAAYVPCLHGASSTQLNTPAAVALQQTRRTSDLLQCSRT